MKKLNVYVGYDSSNIGQELAYSVCERSLKAHSNNINVLPIKLDDLKRSGMYYRDEDTKQSTEFTYSRFLVPALNNYKDLAVFCDSDFVWMNDITSIIDYIDDTLSISCVPHEYTECPTKTKMDGKVQEWYPKKNWSSLIVFNCEHEDCKSLTIDHVNTETAKYLHRFEWTSDENIGNIPIDYNYLVGYYNHVKSPEAYHFTDGGPWHRDYADCEHSEVWLEYLTKDERKMWDAGNCWSL